MFRLSLPSQTRLPTTPNGIRRNGGNPTFEDRALASEPAHGAYRSNYRPYYPRPLPLPSFGILILGLYRHRP